MYKRQQRINNRIHVKKPSTREVHPAMENAPWPNPNAWGCLEPLIPSPGVERLWLLIQENAVDNRQVVMIGRGEDNHCVLYGAAVSEYLHSS
jgi:hypothetical protein